MEKYLIATTKSWNIENAKQMIRQKKDTEISMITSPDQLKIDFLERLKPRYIFFPHWSWIIPREIYQNYECIVFHMTDLPFGRGGSPLQNLLVRGIYTTKISAIKANEGIDTGDVYFKETIDISTGNADDILKRVSEVVFGTMIPRLISESIHPTAQSGEAVVFKRRNAEQSEIPEGLSQRQLYDYIRMLDGEGYPNAFIRTDSGRILFSGATFENGEVTANARFVEERND